MDNLMIDLKLTVAQANIILNHLGRGSYVEVSEIIDQIRIQAAPQIANAQQTASEEPAQEPQSVQ